MNPDGLKRLPPLERLLYWVREREAVRLRKESGAPPPWTDDPILRRYRFCNVRRMDDRVSRWLLDNWYVPHRGHPNALTACVLARQLNNPDSLAAVGFPLRWDPDRAERVLEKRAAAGLKNFSAAYMITGTLGGSKAHQIVRKVVDPIHRDPPAVNTSSLRETAAALVGRAGVSWFIAGQVTADLRWALPGDWADRHAWAPVGPGSARGVKRLYLGAPDAELPAARLPGLLERALDELWARLPEGVTDRLEAIDLQNCLCEWDKYERALWGQGRPKQIYRGGGGE